MRWRAGELPVCRAMMAGALLLAGCTTTTGGPAATRPVPASGLATARPEPQQMALESATQSPSAGLPPAAPPRQLAQAAERPARNEPPQQPDHYAELARELLSKLPSGQTKIHIFVAEFAYQDTTDMLPFSMLIRDELRTALSKDQRVAVLTRERLSDFVDERELRQTSLFQAGNDVAGIPAANIGVGEAVGLVRGRYYAHGPNIRISAELVFFGGGQVAGSAMRTIRALDAGAAFLPSEQPALARQVQFLQEIANGFDLEVLTDPPRQEFRLGDTVRFGLRSEYDVYAAILVHLYDGTVIPLFPSFHFPNNWLPAYKTIWIPHEESDIEFTAQFPGRSFVQVVACTHKEPLDKFLRGLAVLPTVAGGSASGTRSGGSGSLDEFYAQSSTVDPGQLRREAERIAANSQSSGVRAFQAGLKRDPALARRTYQSGVSARHSPEGPELWAETRIEVYAHE